MFISRRVVSRVGVCVGVGVGVTERKSTGLEIACAGTCVEARILQGEEGFRMRKKDLTWWMRKKSRKKERKK